MAEHDEQSEERSLAELTADPSPWYRSSARSISPDYLVCLACGKKQKLLKRHLAVDHDLTPNQYRESFGLKRDYLMVAPNYALWRRELALKIGLGQREKPARRRRKSAARSRTQAPAAPE